MKKRTPYEKLSKKARRAYDAKQRGSWNGVNPVTRKARSKKDYSRKQAQDWKKELPFTVPDFYSSSKTA